MSDDAQTTALIAEQAQIARKAIVPLAAYVLVSTSIYIAVDLLYPDEVGPYFLSAFTVWGFGFALLAVLMRKSAPAGEDHAGGIGSYFGLCLIAGSLIPVAMVLLILPGLYLLMRWTPSYSRLYHTREGVIEAMKWSWEHTDPIQKPLAIALIAPASLYALLFAIGVWYEFNYFDASIAAYRSMIATTDFIIVLAAAWFQLLGVAAYRFIQRRQSQPVEVFE